MEKSPDYCIVDYCCITRGLESAVLKYKPNWFKTAFSMCGHQMHNFCFDKTFEEGLYRGESDPYLCPNCDPVEIAAAAKRKAVREAQSAKILKKAAPVANKLQMKLKIKEVLGKSFFIQGGFLTLNLATVAIQNLISTLSEEDLTVVYNIVCGEQESFSLETFKVFIGEFSSPKKVEISVPQEAKNEHAQYEQIYFIAIKAELEPLAKEEEKKILIEKFEAINISSVSSMQSAIQPQNFTEEPPTIKEPPTIAEPEIMAKPPKKKGKYKSIYD